MIIRIPSLCLVMLIGPTGSGKSFFASKHFSSTEVIDLETFQAFITDDRKNASVNSDALDLIHHVAEKRLKFGKLTVIDATNVSPGARKRFLTSAKACYITPVAFVFSLSENILKMRKKESPDDHSLMHRQYAQMRSAINELPREGLGHVYTFYSEAAVNSAIIQRIPLKPNLLDRSGPFDIIGNLHGCADELETLLNKLGYIKRQYTDEEEPLWGNTYFSHPKGRTAIFLGDMVDMGPRILDTIKIVRNMSTFGKAICVLGNHDLKFYRKLKGRNLNSTNGNNRTQEEIGSLSENRKNLFLKETYAFMGELSSHYILDNGQLVVTHAGIKEKMLGREAADVQQFTIYGDKTPYQKPLVSAWVKEYQGKARVIYGHAPVKDTRWINHTLNINTGCVYGGQLTAYRYPEEDIVSVYARKSYTVPSKTDRYRMNG